MKLYYKSGACSLSPHIVMAELNMAYELEAVDLMTKMTPSGDFRKVNPKGSVPALLMDNGEVLTEGPAIVQYLADQKPEAGLIPRTGTLERYRCIEWLNYITSELHKSFSPLFGADRYVKNAEGQAELEMAFKEAISSRIKFISEKMGENDYLMGKQFTVADAYLYTVLTWTKYVGMDLGTWPNMATYMKRVSERPGVQKAMREEGLLK